MSDVTPSSVVRMRRLLHHLSSSQCPSMSPSSSPSLSPSSPLAFSSTMRWNGWGYDDTKLFLSRRYCAHHSHCAFDRHRRLERYCWKLSGYGIVEGRSTEIEHRPINLHQAGDGLLPEINGDPPSERLAICSDIRIWRLIFEAHP